MPFEVKYNADEDCIHSTFSGSVNMQLVRDYLAELLPLLERTGCCRVLSDCLAAELNLTSRDIMQFPRMAAESTLTARLKRAVVATPGTSGYEMYETLSSIMGQSVRVFNGQDEAMHWLLTDEDAT